MRKMSKLPLKTEARLLSQLTTFGIGGPCNYLEVKTTEEAQEAIIYCETHHVPWLPLGKGSNCLFDDRGFDGLIIHSKIDTIVQSQPGLFTVGSGYSFSLLGTQTARQGFTGLEFASGIPGSVGGAVFMNAGANGCETSQTIVSVDFINSKGELISLSKDQIQFSYRHSLFHEFKGMIVTATFQLHPHPEARKKQLSIIDYRKKTQPLKDYSAGCIFRNPIGNHSGALIENAGLKGLRIGGAKVSEKHANFIVNENQATCQDTLELINLIQQKVKEKFQVELQSEIRYYPYTGKNNEYF